MKKISSCLIIIVAMVINTALLNGQNNKTTKSDPNVPIFEIKNDLGQTVFAVYPGGVHIFIDDQLKATGGGFKVGRIGTEKGSQGDILTVDPGEVNVFIDDPLKATGGGFKVGRIGTEKANGDPDNYLTVTSDSTRIYTSETSDNGFAVGKLNAEIGTVNFLDLTPENYFIGHESGQKTTGQYNLFLGYYAGHENVSGLRNIFIGYNAGYSNEGNESSSTIGHDNIYIGTNAGRDNVDGEHNTLLGSYSGYTSTGTKNTFFGAFTGFASSGKHNVFLGVDAGRNNTTGDNNTFLGTIAGNSNSGGNNTFVGYGSGYYNQTGTGNVFLGYLAGPTGTTVSNQLYINNSTGTPLIWGDFANDRVVINGTSTHNPNSRTFYVNGSAGGDGAWFNDSDVRLKTNINTIGSALEKVLAIRGVSFNWKDDSRGKESQIGFIAQEVENILPEVVDNKNDKYSMQYAPITALLVEAIKEQQGEIEKIKKYEEEIMQLKKENAELKEKLSEIDKLKADIMELKKISKE